MSGEVAGRIALITDASACIPSSHLSRIDLRVVPINVQLGAEEFRSGVDLDDRRPYRALALGLANQLGIRPVFRLRNGTAERLGLPRSEQSALGRIVREWRAGGGPQGRRTAVFHAARPELAGELARMVGEVSFITEFSAAMAIHTGPGVVGVAWLRPSDGELPP